MKLPFLSRKEPAKTESAPEFTGSCPVRQHTGDGAYVSPCCHATYAGRCHVHGDVARFLGDDSDLADADDRLLPIETGH